MCKLLKIVAAYNMKFKEYINTHNLLKRATHITLLVYILFYG